MVANRRDGRGGFAAAEAEEDAGTAAGLGGSGACVYIYFHGDHTRRTGRADEEEDSPREEGPQSLKQGKRRCALGPRWHRLTLTGVSAG